MSQRHDDDDGYDDLDDDRHNDNDVCDENYDNVLVIEAVYEKNLMSIELSNMKRVVMMFIIILTSKRVWNHKKFCQTQIKIWKRRIKKAPPSMGN